MYATACDNYFYTDAHTNGTLTVRARAITDIVATSASDATAGCSPHPVVRRQELRLHGAGNYDGLAGFANDMVKSTNGTLNQGKYARPGFAQPDFFLRITIGNFGAYPPQLLFDLAY